MAKKTTRTILEALKAAGVTMESDAKDTLTEALEELDLVNASEAGPGDGEIVIKKTVLTDLQRDLKKAKDTKREIQAEHDDLKESVDKGDSDNARRLRLANTELEKARPVIDSIMKRERERWKEIAPKLAKDEKLKPFYKFAEEGSELDDAQVLANLTKADEHITLKAFDPTAKEAEALVPPNTPKGSPDGKPPAMKKEDWEKLPRSEQMAAGYTYKPAKSPIE